MAKNEINIVVDLDNIQEQLKPVTEEIQKAYDSFLKDVSEVMRLLEDQIDKSKSQTQGLLENQRHELNSQTETLVESFRNKFEQYTLKFSENTDILIETNKKQIESWQQETLENLKGEICSLSNQVQTAVKVLIESSMKECFKNIQNNSAEINSIKEQLQNSSESVHHRIDNVEKNLQQVLSLLTEMHQSKTSMNDTTYQNVANDSLND